MSADQTQAPTVVIALGADVLEEASLFDAEISAREATVQDLVGGVANGVELEPYFQSVTREKLESLIRRAQRLSPEYDGADLRRWYGARMPLDLDPGELIAMLRATTPEWRAYREPLPAPPPVNPDDDPRSGRQFYLEAAQPGIDARYAWTFVGGDGIGQAVVDLEQGWTLNHEDLPPVSLISGRNHSHFGHGTAVLGVVAAVDNDRGVVGIATNVDSVRVVSEWRTDERYNTADAILSAVAEMAFGDVLLLESQSEIPELGRRPNETVPACFDVIRLATALGIVVVAAAGNGAADLDENEDGRLTLNPDDAEFRDSGAILVGAAGTLDRGRWQQSNFGKRLDCYAWGQDVTATGRVPGGQDTDDYTDFFEGTSAAAAIVAGAALSLQGICQANFGRRLDSIQMRALLGDAALGTPSLDPDQDKIGVMPDLRRIIDSGSLGLPADLLRAHS